MRPYVGNGWYIRHLTDRVCDLAKESYEYRRFVGTDGFVRVRAEPGMSRSDLLDAAIKQAVKSDAALLQRVLRAHIPTGRDYFDYRNKLRRLTRRMETGEEAGTIGVKRP